jgi:hypothetical protein
VLQLSLVQVSLFLAIDYGHFRHGSSFHVMLPL